MSDLQEQERGNLSDNQDTDKAALGMPMLDFRKMTEWNKMILFLIFFAIFEGWNYGREQSQTFGSADSMDSANT